MPDGVTLANAKRSTPLSYATAQLGSAILSFATDSPVAVRIWEGIGSLSDRDTVIGRFRALSAVRYTEIMEQAAENAFELTAEHQARLVRRRLGVRTTRHVFSYHYPWPAKAEVERAVSAYAAAQLSFLPSSRILNFWRAFEAVRQSHAKRQDQLMRLTSTKLAPVWSELRDLRTPGGAYRIRNTSNDLRKAALSRWAELLEDHGDASSAGDYLANQCRGKSAHADKSALEYDYVDMAGTHLDDATLLRYVARCAIEESWF